MNNVLLRKVTLTTQFQPLSTKSSEVLSVTVRMPSGNKQEVVFLGENGVEVPWEPGTQFRLAKVDLAAISVKGRAGDLVILAGGTW
jgi:hypothetical protein